MLLLSASEGREPSAIRDAIEAIGFPCEVHTEIQSTYDALREGAGCMIVESEAITERAVRILSKALAERPPWSDLPILVLADEPEEMTRLSDLDLFSASTSTNITLLRRPVPPATLVTVVRLALRARKRQYQVRDLLQSLEGSNEALRHSEEAVRAANEILETRVQERTEQVRRLALALTTAEQRERARISSILHDHLQQILFSARVWAETLRDEEDAAPPDSLDQIISLLSTAIDTTRTLTVELSPPVLHRKGLAKALRWLADHVKTKYGLEVHVEVDDTVGVDHDDLRTLLFESTRELLFNVVKHANVATATLRMGREDGRCVVEVEDEGDGFSPDALDEGDAPTTEEAGGFGIFSVRERLNLAGGNLHIDSAPGRGTRVRIEAPTK